MDPQNPFNDVPTPHASDSLYATWFADLTGGDPEGSLSGSDAVAFFSRSGLPRSVLAKVWTLSDTARAGVLDVRGFNKAMALIGLAQRGHPVSADAYVEAAAAGDLGPPDMERAPAVPPPPPATADQPPGAPGAPPPPPTTTTAAAPPLPSSVKKVSSVREGLRALYASKIRPLEEAFSFPKFAGGGTTLTDSHWSAKPAILLLGSYSSGKTSFCSHLLGRPYEAAHIGPEPTTDRFVIVSHGVTDHRTPGNTLVVKPDSPWSGLASFGSAFLTRLEAVTCPAPLLEEVTLIDTPGVLAGDKQRVDRAYDFCGVTSLLASRADLILVLADAHKVDFSDEFQQVLHSLRGQEDKIRIVFNKCDAITDRELLRVYGALLWSLSRVLRSPEVVRVYVSSFNAGAPLRSDVNPGGVALFKQEAADLLADVRALPARAVDRKIAEFASRVKELTVHCRVIDAVRKAMPLVGSKSKAKAKLVADLPSLFRRIATEHGLPLSDFPNADKYAAVLETVDISSFPRLRDRDAKALADVLAVDVPGLVAHFDNPWARRTA